MMILFHQLRYESCCHCRRRNPSVYFVIIPLDLRRLDNTVLFLRCRRSIPVDQRKSASTDLFGKLYRIGDRRGAAQKMRIRMVIPANPVHSPENICQMCSESTAVRMKLIDHYIS